MSDPLTSPFRRPSRRWAAAAVFAGVAVAEMSLFLLLGQIRPRAPAGVEDPARPIDVSLYDPLPAPPPPARQPSPDSGGGAPAAPSRVRPQPTPPRPPEIAAPPRPAPTPALVVGQAPTASPEPGRGLGGEGDGAGEGAGPGSGAGGGSSGPRLVTGPTLAQLRANHPRNARSRYGRVELSCRIRLDRRLEGCRVVNESPVGLGFGAAGLAVADVFRFAPPIENGRPVEGRSVTVGIDFGLPPRRQAP